MTNTDTYRNNLKLYIKQLQLACDKRDANSILWYEQMLNIIDDHDKLYHQIKQESKVPNINL